MLLHLAAHDGVSYLAMYPSLKIRNHRLVSLSNPGEHDTETLIFAGDRS